MHLQKCLTFGVHIKHRGIKIFYSSFLFNAEDKEPREYCRDKRAYIECGQCGHDSNEREDTDDYSEYSAFFLLHTEKSEYTCKKRKNSHSCRDYRADIERKHCRERLLFLVNKIS